MGSTDITTILNITVRKYDFENYWMIVADSLYVTSMVKTTLQARITTESNYLYRSHIRGRQFISG